MQRFQLVLLYLFTLFLAATHSFVPPLLVSTKKAGSYLLQSSFYTPEDPFSDHDDPHSFNIEEARKQLEALVGDSSAQQKPSITPVMDKQQKKPPTTTFAPWRPTREDAQIVFPEAPPLTMMDRERRLTELELLKHMGEGDKAISALWEFWFQERGRQSAARLYKAIELAQQRDTWGQAEDILLDLIDTHGMYWAEPVNRLATLYFIQGRLKEAEEMCLTVLHVKPWHFGALSGIVLVYAAMNVPEKARQYAALRLPPLSPQGPTRRRIEWTNRSTEEAQEALWKSEQRLAESFGPTDGHTGWSKPSPLDDYNVSGVDEWQ